MYRSWGWYLETLHPERRPCISLVWVAWRAARNLGLQMGFAHFDWSSRPDLFREGRRMLEGKDRPRAAWAASGVSTQSPDCESHSYLPTSTMAYLGRLAFSKRVCAHRSAFGLGRGGFVDPYQPSKCLSLASMRPMRPSFVSGASVHFSGAESGCALAESAIQKTLRFFCRILRREKSCRRSEKQLHRFLRSHFAAVAAFGGSDSRSESLILWGLWSIRWRGYKEQEMSNGALEALRALTSRHVMSLAALDCHKGGRILVSVEL